MTRCETGRCDVDATYRVKIFGNHTNDKTLFLCPDCADETRGLATVPVEVRRLEGI